MGVCPTSPHVLCGSGEGIRPCPSWYSVGSAPHEYGVRGPLLRAVRSLYDRSRSLVRIAGSKSDLFPVHVGLRQGCPLSPDPVHNLYGQDFLGVASQGAGGSPVGGEVLPQVEEFKYLGVLFTSEGKIEREIDRRIGAASAVMRSVYRTVVVKKELSRKAKLSIYRSIYVPTLTYGHELWVMTERTRSRIQAAEMSFLHRVAGRSLRDRVRSFGHSGGARKRGVPGMSHREEASGKTQDTLERLCLSAGLGTPRGPPRRAGGSVWGEGSLGISLLRLLPPCDPSTVRQIVYKWRKSSTIATLP
ncbi:hypothetical protein L3Q82_019215 [Scortum barcoo]|uniref:Uncharacterized protein n=1 Tax=Scortum barcoo TaxID=214431 RepID=A0ACB8VDK6_9TELE|nr:hypothetical protein L3Q82_019215 [Scortum barcoo]